MTAAALDLWPHQHRAVAEVRAACARGWRRACVTVPTGGGKTRVAAELVRGWLAEGLRVVVYTNRRLLVAQLSAVLDAAGLGHGVRAAGHADERDMPLQVSSIQTEGARVLRRDLGRWDLHDADRVIVDEAHLMTGPTATEVLDRHQDAGAFQLGLTASPIGLRNHYDHLIVAGVPSELRACGALVPALHYGPDEPDLKHVGRVKVGEEWTEKQQVKAIMVAGVFGRVWDWFHKLNPDRRPTLLFAPGVAESMWFAEQFSANGCPAAHVDGSEIWVGGKSYKAGDAERAEILAGSKAGDIKVICNRFVLREGVDMPWVEHGIFACVFGGLQSYLQSGGRLLRASPSTGKVRAVVQDHGGNWHRHGSLNADRDWDLALTPAMAVGLREDRLRSPRPGDPPQPSRCPQCAQILAGLRCPCGWSIDPRRKTRPVIQHDGEPVDVEGDVFTPRRVTFKPDTGKLWTRAYFRARNGEMTFRQAEAFFFQEHRYYPPRTLPYMPQHDRDWYRRVSEVSPDDLIRST